MCASNRGIGPSPGQLVELPAEPVQQHGDVLVLVGVDADDDIVAPQQMSDFCATRMVTGMFNGGVQDVYAAAARR